MWFPKFALRRWRSTRSRPTNPARRKAASPRLTVELLEDRCLLAAGSSAAIVADIVPGSVSSTPLDLLAVNGTLYFSASDSVTYGSDHGRELWKSDRTAAGTVLVKDILPGGGDSYPGGFTNLGGNLYFSAADGVHGRELWKSNGTAAGTVLVKDINPGGRGGVNWLTNVNGTLFFIASDGGRYSAELWKSDGTANGTIGVKDIRTDGDSIAEWLTNVNGVLFFVADDGNTGRELWKSDGTANGTVLIKDIFPGKAIQCTGGGFGGFLGGCSKHKLPNSSNPGTLTNVNGRLYFTAIDGVNGRELWTSDGTAAGTVLVKDIYSGSSTSDPSGLTDVNGTLFFWANDGTNGRELWRSDGTAAGTVRVKSATNNLPAVNSTLFFTPSDSTNGTELWKTDGTAAGTVLVKDINPGPSNSNPSRLTNVNGLLYFRATDGTHGNELWQSDGSEAGTVLVRDINPGGASSNPEYLVAMNNKLYFSADDGEHGRELWDPPPVPNDPLFDKLDGLHVTGAQQAWDLTTGSTRIVVAVIDTGVDYTHPDLYKNIWLNQAEIPASVRPNLQDVDRDGLITFWDLNEPVNQGLGKITDLNGTGFIDGGDLLRPVGAGGWADGIETGGNGYIDDFVGWDFGDNDNDPRGPNPHGTHVAGIIGAVGNNGVGVVGVNWKVQIMAAKIHPDAGMIVGAPAAPATIYAVDNGARVSNHSYGGDALSTPPAVIEAGRQAGLYAAAHNHLAVAAAGNNTSDNDVLPFFPASYGKEYGLPNGITVAATTKQDKLAHFSNYGATSVDLGGPGVNIWSTLPGNDYEKRDGTSSSAPFVAGAAALILSRNPNLSFTEVKALILGNVDPVADLAGKTVTGGRLNIYKAVSATPLPLVAAAEGHSTNIPTLTNDEVSSLWSEALLRWSRTGVDVSALHGVDVRIANLGGLQLGMASGMASSHTIWLDDNAAGWGWFVDPTPWDDSEFTTPGNQGEQHRMDLLTVLEHELGHVLGFDHQETGVMEDTLGTGTRKTPTGQWTIGRCWTWYSRESKTPCGGGSSKSPRQHHRRHVPITATASASRPRPSSSTSAPRPTRPLPTARGSAPSSTTNRGFRSTT